MTAPTTIFFSTGGQVRELERNGALVATLGNDDPDLGETFLYTLADPSGAFELVGSEVRVRDGSRIDFETSPSMPITVTVTDSTNNQLTATLAIQVINLNDVVGTDQPNVLVGTTGADAIEGLGGNDSIAAGEGDDILYGGAGDDTLDGGLGNDVMLGGTGNDVFLVDAGGDLVVEATGEGRDLVYAVASYTLQANVENLILQGSASLDATGNDAANSLIGNAGRNVLDGRGGADRMFGHGGNDTYYVDDPGDIVGEGAGLGVDLVRSTISKALFANVENLILEGSADINGSGNDLANSLIGNDGNNVLDGRGGVDRMFGHAGDDTYIVDNPGDLVGEIAGNGIDTVRARIDYTLGNNVERLILSVPALNGTGNTLANEIFGNASDNRLDGGDGNDTLVGGVGNDTMTGGTGTDVYRYFATGLAGGDVAAGQADTIVSGAGDRIDLAPELEGILRIGGQALSALTANTAVGSAFDARNSVRFTGGHLQIDLDGDRAFTAGSDFDIGLAGVGSVTYDATADNFQLLAAATRRIALTFDDGPDPTYTQQVLSVLSAWNVHATFFMLGQEVQQSPDIVRSVFDAGHLIANHTYDHPDLTTLTAAQITSQLQQTSDAIFAITGEQPAYFRPPYGNYDAEVQSVAAALGMDMVLWTLDTNDWRQPGVDAIVQSVLSGATDQGVVLMHDGGGNRSQTVSALNQIIPGLQSMGYELVTLDQLTTLPTSL